MSEPAPWTIDLDVREDATRVFVPGELLPNAAVGDLVDVSSASPHGVRRGRVIEEVRDPDRGRYLTVTFE